MDIYPIYNDEAAPECRIPAHHMNAGTLGGKGYNLVTMAELGLPVPSGVIIPTYVSKQYLAATDDAARSEPNTPNLSLIHISEPTRPY